MTGVAAPALLARDREQLDRVVRLLLDGRPGFFVIVCAPQLRPAAIRYLAEASARDVPEPVGVSGHDEMVDRMVELDEGPPGAVRCLRIESADVDVLTAMNWHREKLRRAGQVLLWLDSVERLGEVQRHAPDAYSIREAALVLAGEGGSEAEWMGEGEEPPDLRALRLLFELPRSPEERAQAARELVQALEHSGRLADADAVAREGLALIPGDQYPAARERRLRAWLLADLSHVAGSQGRAVECHRAARAAIRELGPARSGEEAVFQWWIELRASSNPALGPDLRLLQEASLLNTIALQPFLFPVRQVEARAAEIRGKIRTALDIYARTLAAPGISLWDKASLLLARCRMLRRTGRFARAEEDMAAAESAFHRAGAPLGAVEFERGSLLLNKGEIDAARRAAEHVNASPVSERGRVDSLTVAASQAVSRAAGYAGDMHIALDMNEQTIAAAAAGGFRDELVLAGCLDLVHLLEQATSARALPEGEPSRSLEVLDSTGRALIEYAAGDPPWYDVLVPGLRASALSLDPARHAEAIAAAERAVALARSRWEQALPRTTRILVQCLARAGRWADMAPAIGDALRSAREDENLRELATVQAHDLVRLLHVGAPRGPLERAHSDLRSTFAEMDAPRIEGETWLEVAPLFPPLATFPDPVAIADRLHDLFFDMPMPEPAARCMEWLGDLHLARGDRAQAETCYRLSLGTLARYGLLLRKPLLEEKLGAGRSR